MLFFQRGALRIDGRRVHCVTDRGAGVIMKTVGGGVLMFGKEKVDREKRRYGSEERKNYFRKDVDVQQSLLVGVSVAVSWLRRCEGLADRVLDPATKVLPGL